MKNILAGFIGTIFLAAFAQAAQIDPVAQAARFGHSGDNILIAAPGLTAPAGVEDSYGWALGFILANPYEFGLLRDFARAPGKLAANIVGNTEGLNCWLGRKAADLGKQIGARLCFTREELLTYLADNRVFMQRFRQLAVMSRAVDLPQHRVYGVHELIAGEKFYLAALAVDDDREEALTTWLEHMAAVRKWNADNNGFIARSVTMQLYALASKQLPSILGDNRLLAGKYKERLSAVLMPFGPKEMNIGLSVKTDLLSSRRSFDKLGPENLQRLFDMQDEFLAMVGMPPVEFENANDRFFVNHNPVISEDDLQIMERINYKSREDFSEDEKRITTDMLIKGVILSSNMMGTMHILDTNTRMLNIYAQIRAQNIARRDIAEFVKSAPPEMQDPYAGRAFNYDPATNMLWSICKHAYNIEPPACSLSLD